MQQDTLGQNDNLAWVKLLLLWFGAWLGTITLSQIVLFATLILTCMQIWKTWKELQRKKGGTFDGKEEEERR